MIDKDRNIEWLKEHGFEKTEVWQSKSTTNTDWHAKKYPNGAIIYAWWNFEEDLWYAMQTNDTVEWYMDSGKLQMFNVTAEKAVEDCIARYKEVIDKLSTFEIMEA